jgi:hypothetical protein
MAAIAFLGIFTMPPAGRWLRRWQRFWALFKKHRRARLKTIPQCGNYKINRDAWAFYNKILFC